VFEIIQLINQGFVAGGGMLFCMRFAGQVNLPTVFIEQRAALDVLM
jgi:hypothetical protein